MRPTTTTPSRFRTLAGSQPPVVALAACLLLASCMSEKKVVRYHPFLANVPGAVTGTAPVGDRYDGYVDPTEVKTDSLVIENPNGSKKLVSACVRHVMIHVMNCMADGTEELLFEQIISEETKRNYRGRGEDPHRVLRYLDLHYDDIATLFSRMPMAEHSPSVILHQPSKNMFLLELTGLATKGSRFTKLWVTLENGTWKFVWVA